MLTGDGFPIGDELALAGPGATQPSMAVNSAGDVLIAWTAPDDDGMGIFARLVDRDLAAVGAPLRVNGEQRGWQSSPQVAAGADDRFLVSWSHRIDPQPARTAAQLVTAAGGLAGGERSIGGEWETSNLAPNLVALPDGGYAHLWVVWNSWYAVGLYAEILDEVGAPVGEPTRVSDTRPQGQHRFGLAAARRRQALRRLGRLQRSGSAGSAVAPSRREPSRRRSRSDPSAPVAEGLTSPAAGPAAAPLGHHHRRSRAGVQRPGGAVLGDRDDALDPLVAPPPTAPGPLDRTGRASPPAGRPSKSGSAPATLSTPTTGSPSVARPGDEIADRRMVDEVLVDLGHHRAASVPAPPADEVDGGGEEGVGVAHHRADVRIVQPVLDRDVEGVTAAVEVGDDRLDPPVAVALDDVATVAAGEQLGVEPRVVRPGLGMRPDADLPRSLAVAHDPVGRVPTNA
jgi:hypothetical protein